MAGTIEGARKAAARNKQLYGSDFYGVIGRMGGLASRGGGFAAHRVGRDGLTGPERARIAGSKGGKANRRPRRRV
jgi:hypothetical protein